LNSNFRYNRWFSVTEQFSIRWLSTSHLSKWAWKACYWYSKVCVLPRPSHWNQQRRYIKNKTLQQTWWLHLFIGQLPFHQWQYSSITRVWSLLIRYSRAYAQYCDLLDSAQLLTKLLKQSYASPRLGWSNHYKNYTVVIIIWLTATKYPYLTMDHLLFTWMFSFLYHYHNLLPDLTA
jgi:hypothetical protein